MSSGTDSPGNALSQERLAAGIDLVIQCSSSKVGLDAPAGARVRLDQELVARILEVRCACAEHKLEFASVKGGPAEYDQAGAAIGGWSLRVDERAFWTFGLPNSEGSVWSEHVPLDALMHTLKQPMSTPGADGFMWYGGALLFLNAFVDPVDFVSTIQEDFPRLAARERELQMATVLEERTATGARTEPAPVKRSARI